LLPAGNLAPICTDRNKICTFCFSLLKKDKKASVPTTTPLYHSLALFLRCADVNDQWECWLRLTSEEQKSLSLSLLWYLVSWLLGLDSVFYILLFFSILMHDDLSLTQACLSSDWCEFLMQFWLPLSRDNYEFYAL